MQGYNERKKTAGALHEFPAARMEDYFIEG